MRKTQPKSLESVLEALIIIHLAFVKTQFAFFIFLKNNQNTLLNYKDQLSGYIYIFLINLELNQDLLSKRIMFCVCGGIGTITP